MGVHDSSMIRGELGMGVSLTSLPFFKFFYIFLFIVFFFSHDLWELEWRYRIISWGEGKSNFFTQGAEFPVTPVPVCSS